MADYTTRLETKHNRLVTDHKIVKEERDRMRMALVNIRNFVRDNHGSDWDHVRSFCKEALSPTMNGK